MNRIIAFGDSWTHGHGVETDPQYKEIANPNPFIFNLRMNNSWVRWLADKFCVPFVNFGLCGIDNVDIVDTLDQYKNNLEINDVVIIMLSFPYRHVNKQHRKNINLLDIITRAESILSTNKYYFVNSFYPTFKEEPELIEQIDKSKWICIDRCAADILTQYEIDNDVSVWEYQSRKVFNDKRNFYMGDYHPNLLGYQIIADWLYKELIKVVDK